ncbi:hypothetical protein E5358_13485 [Palleniella muris]|uniref:Uncharacterized protein n=1 Tax=Palleniella muris TaxID=3038145 RepID=A0AC61QMA9_9BACT|nr:hypothetical protein [Palleniella muris]TGX80211.1 hypothetical protein E5358_13485 [Palleniella muris]
MKLFNKTFLAGAAMLTLALGFTACEDANEYKDAETNNPAWTGNNPEGIAHPESLGGSKWLRGEGIKVNAYGEEIQGFVESLEFIADNSVVVKMSQGKTEGTMGADETNTVDNPYECEYVKETGSLKIKKEYVDDKGNHSKKEIFSGVVVSGTKYGDMITLVHYGDTPVQTYLVRQ